jgi:hypothetical protein
VYCFCIFSKKLNLIQETSFYYRNGDLIQIRETLLRGRLSTVDLLVLTSLGQLLLILKIWFTLFTKHATLMRRPFPSVSILCPNWLPTSLLGYTRLNNDWYPTNKKLKYNKYLEIKAQWNNIFYGSNLLMFVIS